MTDYKDLCTKKKGTDWGAWLAAAVALAAWIVVFAMIPYAMDMQEEQWRQELEQRAKIPLESGLWTGICLWITPAKPLFMPCPNLWT